MRIDDLTPALGSKTLGKRLGRGIGSGLGKTSGKGHKGQWARSGGGVRVGFEGGQMPLARRLPKTGFENNWRKVYSTINLGELENFDDNTIITAELLKECGILSKIEPYGLKVLGEGTLTKKLTIQAKKFSKSAALKLEQIGGKVEVL